MIAVSIPVMPCWWPNNLLANLRIAMSSLAVAWINTSLPPLVNSHHQTIPNLRESFS
jgi:hypothetical protein